MEQNSKSDLMTKYMVNQVNKEAGGTGAFPEVMEQDSVAFTSRR